MMIMQLMKDCFICRQSRTSIDSDVGQRYINHRKADNTILLFVRENKRENTKTSPYYFLGKAKLC